MKFKLKNQNIRGILLMEALLLLLIALLAAGFTYYLGRRIIDWIKELRDKREKQHQELLPTNEVETSSQKVIRVEYLDNKFYLTSVK